MHSLKYGKSAIFVIVFGAALPCFGQSVPGPATHENSANSSGQNSTSAVPEPDAAEAPSKRPSGTAARPEDGVQHPHLDKAWADYEAIVVEATKTIFTAIANQIDTAAAKGDLNAVEKWQAALGKFENDGEVPAAAETKAVVNDAVANCKKAKEELVKAYEAVQKTLTTEKNFDEAKLVREEAKLLTQPRNSVVRPKKSAAKPPQPVAVPKTLASTLLNSSWTWDSNGEITFLPNDVLMTKWSSGRQVIGHWNVDGTTVIASWDGVTHRLTFDLQQGIFVSIRNDGNRSTGMRHK